MDECIISDEQISYIAHVFSVPVNVVRCIHDEYVADAYEIFSEQYLAHAIRSMEVYIAKKRGLNSYHIICIRMANIDPVGFPKDNRFFIFYPSNLGPKESRMAIAHELGHLFCWSEKDYNPKDKDRMEAISSVFGLILLFARNKYYSNKEDPFRGKAWQRIVDDFAAVCQTQPSE